MHVPLALPGFGIDWTALEAALSPRTRAIVLNTPHNPSGALVSAADLDRLAALIRGRDLYLVSDEVYEHLVYDGERHASVIAHDELYARAFVVSSFGKTYHVTGWKTGYVVAPPALSAELRKVHQYVSFCGVTPIQRRLPISWPPIPNTSASCRPSIRPSAISSAICWVTRASASSAPPAPISRWSTIPPFARIWTTWPWPSG